MKFLRPAQRFARLSAIERGDIALPFQKEFDDEKAYLAYCKQSLLDNFAFTIASERSSNIIISKYGL